MKPGILYIIASPIGNLEDITLRALKTLKEKTDYIYCEDTRQTKKLLSCYDIKLPVQSLHAHSSDAKINLAITRLKEGKSVAYLTDSGTPGISDPGAKLVRNTRLEEIPVVPIPGPSAFASLISVSGFPGKNILFLGFLSKKDSKKRKELIQCKDFDGVIVIFESPHRIKRLLTAIYEIFPDSQIIIGREMTKIYEEFITGSIERIYSNLNEIKELGEFTVAVFTGKQ